MSDEHVSLNRGTAVSHSPTPPSPVDTQPELPASKVSLAHALNRYQATVSILKKGFKQENYRVKVILRSPLANKILSEITTVDIADYRDDRLQQLNPRTKMTISPTTVRLELALLSHLFDVASIEWGYCKDNPVLRVRKPKPAPGRTRRLLPREERMIMRYAAQHRTADLHPILVIALETAMRQGEILSLRWENIDLRKRIARLPITKNGETRDVPLSLDARDALTKVGTLSEGRVFSYTSAGLKSAWRIMIKRLGIEDLHFHDLRHEAISRLHELGTMDSMEVSVISGHKSMAMLKRYTHLKAHKLVNKLEGSRSKGRTLVLNHLVPYPGILSSACERGLRVRLYLPDFEDLYVEASSTEQAIQQAQDKLLRKILLKIRNNERLPRPDEYLDYKGESDRIVMIDPLATEGQTVL